MASPPLLDLRNARHRRRKAATPEHAHPLVRKLFALMDENQIADADMAERRGLGVGTVWTWRGTKQPLVPNFEAALHQLTGSTSWRRSREANWTLQLDSEIDSGSGRNPLS